MRKLVGVLLIAIIVGGTLALTGLALVVVHPAHACQVAGGMGGMTPCHA